MSGGFDSTASAILLSEQGYKVIGLTLKMVHESFQSNTSYPYEEVDEARETAEQIGIEHHILDVRTDFKKWVIDDFVNEYLSGRTPNPCINCNIHIKWRFLSDKAAEYGCDQIATGHYARNIKENGYYVIHKAKDIQKDQSYFLWRLDQEVLSKTLFPLGNYKKSALNHLFNKSSIIKPRRKQESMEVCFIPGNNYREFIKHNNPKLTEKLKNGNFLDTSGKYLGKHKGYPFYTIGQRRGLELAVGYPLYVLKIHPESNTIILGSRDELYKKELTAKHAHFLTPGKYDEPFEAITKIRYNSQGEQSWIHPKEDDTIRIKFKKPVFAVTPGQSAVFYDGDKLLGGAIISS